MSLALATTSATAAAPSTTSKPEILSSVLLMSQAGELLKRAAAQLQPADLSASSAEPLIPPRIGHPWQGGIYAGICRGADGMPDHHLVLGAPRPERMPWADAMAWAQGLEEAGFADWFLPTRRESALLFANLGDALEPCWHWTSEQHSRNAAWFQNFDVGFQYSSDESYEGRACAVRRLLIQSFAHS